MLFSSVLFYRIPYVLLEGGGDVVSDRLGGAGADPEAVWQDVCGWRDAVPIQEKRKHEDQE